MNQISHWLQQVIYNMALCFGKVSIGAVSEDKVIDLHAKTEQLTLEVGFFERTFTMAGLPNAKR